MEHDVFISYSSCDRATADRLCEELEHNDIRCWIAPRDIPPGTDYGELIHQAIVSCRIFIILFSLPASRSRWVAGELNIAFTEGKYIIPYRIDTTPLEGAMRLLLNQSQWIEADSVKEDFSEIVGVCLRILNVPCPTSEKTTGKKTASRRARMRATAVAVLFVLVLLVGLSHHHRSLPELWPANDSARIFYQLGVNYATGDGVPQDSESARTYFARAREADTDTLTRNARYQAFGYGATDSEIVRLLIAAQRGDATSQYQLAERFYMGEGVSKNLLTAQLYYLKAAEQNYRDAALKATLLDRPIITLDAPAGKYGTADVLLKAILDATDSELALWSEFGIRDSLHQSVSYINLWRIEPFRARIRTLELSGAELEEVIRESWELGGRNRLVTSFSCTLTLRADSLSTIRTELDPQRRYTVATSDYIVSVSESLQGRESKRWDLEVPDMMASYLTTRRGVIPDETPRIQIIQE